MAESAVCFTLGEVLQLLKEETNLLRGVHRDFSDIKDELESIQDILKDADRSATNEAATYNYGIRSWVKQLREASFRVEDVIDEYLWLMCGANPPGREASVLCEVTSSIKTLISRLSSLFIEENEIVGVEGPGEELFGWLLEGAAESTVISVVGLGKTTLAKLVFDTQKVTTQFDCHACITVSQLYTVRGLLINIVEQFCKGTEDPLPQLLHKMDDKSRITEM